MATKILVADDHANIIQLIKLYLEKEGYVVCTALNGKDALEIFKYEDISLAILDIMMPELDGNEVCREIRKTSNIPIIMLTAKSETIDKVLSLGIGADDYMVKPFDPNELIARVKAILRRSDNKASDSKDDEKCVKYDKLEINLSNYELKIDGKLVSTPPRELELLYFLASHPNKVFTREEILQEVWGFEYPGDSTRTIDVHIKRLRAKLAGLDTNWELMTIYRVGYKFEVR